MSLPNRLNLDAALQYAALGLRVFPLRPWEKVPATVHGFHDATVDLDRIHTWWTDDPRRGVAIVTGQGLAVVDVDPRNGGDVALPSLGALPLTVEARTGGRGRHLYFTVPNGTVRSRKLAQGIDLKAEGGYVVAPPSIHPEGTPYAWLPGAAPWERDFAELPSALVVPATPESPPERRYGPSQRNSALTSLAGSMRYRGMAPEAILQALLVENAAHCFPPLDPSEVRRIAASVGRYPPGIEPPGVVPLEPPTVTFEAMLTQPPFKVGWAIPSLLAERDIALISGAGGLGKTWLAYSLAVSLATGRKLFDHWPVTKGYRVAVLDLEMQPWEVDLRLQRLMKGLHIHPDEVRDRGWAVRERLQVDDDNSFEKLLLSLEKLGAEFLLIDSFRRAFDGNENDSSVISRLFRNLDRVRTSLGCGVVLTDHTRKLTGENGLDSADQSLRGSTDKRNMVDAHFGVSAKNEFLGFEPTKTRHSLLPEPVLLKLLGLDDEDEEDGPVTVVYQGPASQASGMVQDAVLVLLARVGSEGMLRGELIGRSHYSEPGVRDALRTLVRAGKVWRKKEGNKNRYFIASGHDPDVPK